MVLLRPPDVVEETGQVREENQPPDAGAGESASFLDEDQRAGIDGHLPDVGEAVAEAIPPFPDDPHPLPDQRLGGEQFPGERHLPFPLQIETGRPDLGGDLPGQIDGPDVFRIRQSVSPPFRQDDFRKHEILLSDADHHPFRWDVVTAFAGCINTFLCMSHRRASSGIPGEVLLDTRGTVADNPHVISQHGWSPLQRG